MIMDALARKESCGCHFNEAYQTEENEAKRDDENFCHVAAWEYAGYGTEPLFHKEELIFENVELTPHEVDKVFYHGPQIDLSIGIREAIVLSLPITPSCRDDCRGLCPVCGINLNKGSCACKREQVGLFTAVAAKHKKTTAKKVKRKRK